MNRHVLSMYLRSGNHKLNIVESCVLPLDSICIRIRYVYSTSYHYYICNGILYRKHFNYAVDLEFIFKMEYL